MRIRHNLWRVSNGWLLVPEDVASGILDSAKCHECAVFRTLKEFADQYPKRERKSKKHEAPMRVVNQ